MTSDNEVLATARRAKDVTAALRRLTRAEKDRGLHAIADALIAQTRTIVAANAEDVAAATEAGTPPAILDRLTLDPGRIAAIAAAVREVAELSDPVGEVVRGYTLPNGLRVEQTRVPMGVVGMIYEARPNVTVDAAVLCLKSGNAALLRGSASAFRSNTALVEIMQSALRSVGLPAEAIQLVPGLDHDSVKALMTARGLVDVLIPRGGAGLINSVVTNATVPVIETGIGNVHIYVDPSADLEMAARIAVNSKVQRVSVCNTAETLLVHEGVGEDFFAICLPLLAEAGVTLHADDGTAKIVAGLGSPISVEPVTDDDWAAEYYSLDLAVGLVPDIDTAIAHIGRWSSGHTDAIVADSATAIARFVSGVDSAAIMVNASTRFTDGGEFGFGAEIGISTQKLHARGPMALPELTTTTYVVTGSGQVRT